MQAENASCVSRVDAKAREAAKILTKLPCFNAFCSQSSPCQYPGCIQSSVSDPTLESGTVGSIAGLNLQTAGSEGIAARWDALCPDVKRIILGHLSLYELGCIASLCRDIREAFLIRFAEEQAKLTSVGHETFGKDMFSAIVRAIQSFLAAPDPYPNPNPFSRNVKCLSINAAGQYQPVSCHVAEGCRIDGCSFFILRCWYEAELLWKFPGSCNNIGSIRIIRLPANIVGGTKVMMNVSEGAGAAAMGLLLAICAENLDAMPAFRPFKITALTLEGLQGAAQKREADNLIGPLKAMANSFYDFSTRHYSGLKVVQGRPLGQLQLR